MLATTLDSNQFESLLFSNLASLNSLESTNFLSSMQIQPQITKKANIILVSNAVEKSSPKTKKIKKLSFGNKNQSETSSDEAAHKDKKQSLKKQKKKDPDFFVKKQKNDRNVVSNIVHHLLKHCLSPETKKLIESICCARKLNLKTEEFYEILEQKSKMCKTYITNRHLQLLWKDQTNKQYSKVIRIVSKIFLQNYAFLNILFCNKLSKQSKTIHYKGRRELLSFISSSE